MRGKAAAVEIPTERGEREREREKDWEGPAEIYSDKAVIGIVHRRYNQGP